SPQKWHPYSYCWGNPVTMVDKDGREGSRVGIVKVESSFGTFSGTFTFACGNDLAKAGVEAKYSQNLFSGSDKTISGTAFVEVAGQRLLQGGGEYNFSTGEGSISGG